MIRELTEDGWEIKPLDEDKAPELTTRRMSAVRGRNRKQGPTKKYKLYLLDKYLDSCAYCSRQFGSWINIDRKVHRITCQWDHVIPHSYTQDNNDLNFLPACQFCNIWKRDKLFDTVERVTDYVETIWAQKTSEGL